MKEHFLNLGLAAVGIALLAAGLRGLKKQSAGKDTEKRDGADRPAAAPKRASRDPETLEQLEELLQEGGFPRYSYSLEGGLPSEAYCVERTPEGWHVYYSERGNKSTIGRCATEKEAVACFLKEVRPYLKLDMPEDWNCGQ